MSALRIAGVTVLYKPGVRVIENVNTYIGQIEKLYVVDNSGNIDWSVINVLRQNKKIEYINNAGNWGIAKALNTGITKALDEKFDFLLTMDQDTSVDANLIAEYKKFLRSNDNSIIGILAPTPLYKWSLRSKKLSESKEETVIITSGNLVNLSVYKKIGAFKNELFIDYVDYEYCLRLKKNKFKIFRLASAKIYHQLGEIESRRFAFRNIFVTHHSALRYYYRTRNRFFVYKTYFTKFPVFVVGDLFVFVNELVKIFFYERDKLKKINMIFLGLVDFFKNKYGSFASIHHQI